MKKIIFFILLQILWANDAEYYTSANEIVPLKSKNISLDKEVLNIKYLKLGEFKVDVLYTLYNKDSEKDTVIGFEAPKPIGEDRMDNEYFYKPYNTKLKTKFEFEAIDKKLYADTEQPPIEDFAITVNGKNVNYEIVDVSKIKNQGSTPFVGYLYYFYTHLKHGKNTLHQTYKCMTSGSVFNKYEFEYILATAKEWSGGKIRDFTINLELNKFANVNIVGSFFNSLRHWQIKNGKAILSKNSNENESQFKLYKFYLVDGKASYHKKDFIPKMGIILYSKNCYSYDDPEEFSYLFDYQKDKLKFSICYHKDIFDRYKFFAKDAKSLKILKNLPFARRGYIFKTPYIQNYYKKMVWYKPNPHYKATLSSLTQKERNLLKDISTLKRKILRNLPYAKRGYTFKDEKLSYFFQNYKWYHPNPKYKPSFNKLTPKEQNFIKAVKSKKSISDSEFFTLFNLVD